MNLVRDFNKEYPDNDGRKYFYGFDYEVMHHYMIRTFQPFVESSGNALELGSFQGGFSRRLLKIFNSLTCVEASSEAIEQAKTNIKQGVEFVNCTIEQYSPKQKFDHVFLTHVLEHVENPVEVLERVSLEFLSPNGRLFLVCPNANAPSRQIAVKMGLISHHQAVTEPEALHGHYRTYTFDTLERDVKAAGLKIAFRSGIFFKAFANFQWDKILETDIVSQEYLDGCFELGQVYPDLCSSIFLLCEKNK